MSNNKHINVNIHFSIEYNNIGARALAYRVRPNFEAIGHPTLGDFFFGLSYRNLERYIANLRTNPVEGSDACYGEDDVFFTLNGTDAIINSPVSEDIPACDRTYNRIWLADLMDRWRNFVSAFHQAYPEWKTLTLAPGDVVHFNGKDWPCEWNPSDIRYYISDAALDFRLCHYLSAYDTLHGVFTIAPENYDARRLMAKVGVCIYEDDNISADLRAKGLSESYSHAKAMTESSVTCDDEMRFIRALDHKYRNEYKDAAYWFAQVSPSHDRYDDAQLLLSCVELEPVTDEAAKSKSPLHYKNVARWTRAIEHITRKLSFPNDAKGRALLLKERGIMYGKIDRFEEARKDLERASRTLPKEPELLYLVGILKLNQCYATNEAEDEIPLPMEITKGLESGVKAYPMGLYPWAPESSAVFKRIADTYEREMSAATFEHWKKRFWEKREEYIEKSIKAADEEAKAQGQGGSPEGAKGANELYRLANAEYEAIIGAHSGNEKKA